MRTGDPVAAALDDVLERVRRREAGDHASDLRVAARAALAGGRAALALYGEAELVAETKAEGSPVTAADRAAEAAVLGVLSTERPGEAVRSEESHPEAGATEAAGTGRLWVVDPLDGTKEFLARNGEFCVMVGLAVGGRAVAGAVHQPAADRLYLGLADRAAWAVDRIGRSPSVRRLRVPSRAARPLRLVRSRSHPPERLERLRAALGEVRLLQAGSVGLKCAWVAEGRADLYVHPVPYLQEWDTCAPEAVLRGAGGRVTDCRGARLTYGARQAEQRRGIFAAGPALHRRVAPMVQALTDEPW